MKFALKIWQAFINRIVRPLVHVISGAKPGSWRERKQYIFFYSLNKILSNWISKSEVSNKSIEESYDKVSGQYILRQDHDGYRKWSVINGKIIKIDTTVSSKLVKEEIWQSISQYNFKSILEVGVGELNTIKYAKNILKDKICFGIDLSLNRLCHGYSEYSLHSNWEISLAKADACYLPFPDKSFDLVFSAHCLELMPKGHAQDAIREMCRVARNQVLMFEPSWELGSYLQKMKMASEQYVRGIPKFINNDLGLKLTEHRLLRNHLNPLNQTALHCVELRKNASNLILPMYACPLCHHPMNEYDSFMVCKTCHRLFFIYKKIPVLDPASSHFITKELT